MADRGERSPASILARLTGGTDDLLSLVLPRNGGILHFAESGTINDKGPKAMEKSAK